MAPSAATVLVVDDDPTIGKVLVALLRQAGLEATHVLTAEAALATLHVTPADLVITDLRMPGMDGMELLFRLSHDSPEIPVIMLTAHGTVPLAVDAMKAGATDFLMKPFDRDEVLFTVEKALAATKAARALPPAAASLPKGLVGDSKGIREMVALLRKAARGNVTVLLRGESGTGKELAARAVHDESDRAKGPFVVVHCAALPETLLESELFGYERGAFTGATHRKPGRVALAEGGTLFLDEIAEVAPALQAKLLRLLQEREYQPLGDTRAHHADVRFVAATHRDLEAMTRTGAFREDLFYRLNVVPVWIPPLRERRGDVRVLAAHFCERLARENGRVGMAFTEDALAALETQPWPGNVRQLQNLVERLVILADGPTLTAEDVARHLADAGAARARDAEATGPSAEPAAPPAVPGGDPAGGTIEARRREAERQALVEALARSQNNRTVAARILGVSRRTLYNKMAELGVT